MLKIFLLDMSFNITNSWLEQHLLGANELILICLGKIMSAISRAPFTNMVNFNPSMDK